MVDTPQQRFLKLDQVGEELNISSNQVYALVRRGDLEAIKIGGRGQWRVERERLEEYIQRTYAETRAFIEAHPLEEDATPDLGLDEVREPSISDAAPSLVAKPAEHAVTSRSVAPSDDPEHPPRAQVQPPSDSLVDLARSHVDSARPLNTVTGPETEPTSPTITRQPRV